MQKPIETMQDACVDPTAFTNRRRHASTLGGRSPGRAVDSTRRCIRRSARPSLQGVHWSDLMEKVRMDNGRLDGRAPVKPINDRRSLPSILETSSSTASSTRRPSVARLRRRSHGVAPHRSANSIRPRAANRLIRESNTCTRLTTLTSKRFDFVFHTKQGADQSAAMMPL